MKQCLECKKIYYDDTLNYCLDDGTRLFAGASGDDIATVAFNDASTADNAATAVVGAATSESESQPRLTNSIAVLPFADMSAEADNEYFCDGLAEELLNALSKIEALHVAARTSAFSFKGKNTDIQDIGRKLNVATVLEGSVRKSGDRLRITAQLINVSNGYHVWSERYDRQLKDIFDIQDEISLAIVDALKVKLIGKEKAEVVKHHTENTEAYQLYLKGRFYANKWTADGIRMAIDFFNEAAEIDSSFALAYSGMADCWSSLSIEATGLSPHEAAPKARAAAQKALELDDSLAEAHTSLALVYLNYDWDWKASGQELKRALELNPKSVPALHWYSHWLVIMGEIDESKNISRHALELDPFDHEINAHLAWHYYNAGSFELAEEQAMRSVEMAPGFHEGYWFLGWIHEYKKSYDKAIEAFGKAVSCSGSSLRMKAELGKAYGFAGRDAEAAKIAEELIELSSRQYVSPYNIALVYTGLRDNDRALEWLEKACDIRAALLPYLRTQWQFDELRSDPRFTQIVERIGLPA